MLDWRDRGLANEDAGRAVSLPGSGRILAMLVEHRLAVQRVMSRVVYVRGEGQPS